MSLILYSFLHPICHIPYVWSCHPPPPPPLFHLGPIPYIPVLQTDKVYEGKFQKTLSMVLLHMCDKVKRDSHHCEKYDSSTFFLLANPSVYGEIVMPSPAFSTEKVKSNCWNQLPSHSWVLLISWSHYNHHINISTGNSLNREQLPGDQKGIYRTPRTLNGILNWLPL